MLLRWCPLAGNPALSYGDYLTSWLSIAGRRDTHSVVPTFESTTLALLHLVRKRQFQGPVIADHIVLAGFRSRWMTPPSGSKAALIDLQNRIVDPRFRNTDYRDQQNYVGESVAWQNEKIHFISPKPEDLQLLMRGLIAAHQRMERADVPAVVHAGTIAYGFVFLHPFEDGNGRIHRFLIHNILARRGFSPEGIMFPISASMLRNIADYDASLEAFSQPLMTIIDYSVDEAGKLTVHNDTALWYAYVDMTPQVEALFRFIEHAIERELVEELSFLASYDTTKKAVQQIVDMPDRHIDLLIRFCLQNHGRLSAKKRASHFAFLTDEEVTRIEQALQQGYHTRLGSSGLPDLP